MKGKGAIMKNLFLANVGIGALMIVLAVPMILKKVKPNVWYGFRTRKTLSDERVWYAANQYAGKALLLAGGVIVVGAVVLYWAASGIERGAILNDLLMLVLWLVVLIVPLAVCERIRSMAGSMTSAASKGSPSQPWPKLTTLLFTLPICARAT